MYVVICVFSFSNKSISFKKSNKIIAVKQSQFLLTVQSVAVVEHDLQAVPAFQLKMTLELLSGITPEGELMDRLQTCLIETI